MQSTGRVSACGGVLVRRLLGGSPRIVDMDGYTIDVNPDGEILFFKNTDRPGVLKVRVDARVCLSLRAATACHWPDAGCVMYGCVLAVGFDTFAACDGAAVEGIGQHRVAVPQPKRRWLRRRVRYWQATLYAY